MKAYSLFISYNEGGHYCAIHPTLGDIKQAIKELLESIDVKDPVPAIKQIKTGLGGRTEDFWHKFTDGTWIHVQELNPVLVERVYMKQKEAAKELCKIYFEIASEAIGEDEVRRRRDKIISMRKKEK